MPQIRCRAARQFFGGQDSTPHLVPLPVRGGEDGPDQTPKAVPISDGWPRPRVQPLAVAVSAHDWNIPPCCPRGRGHPCSSVAVGRQGGAAAPMVLLNSPESVFHLCLSVAKTLCPTGSIKSHIAAGGRPPSEHARGDARPTEGVFSSSASLCLCVSVANFAPCGVPPRSAQRGLPAQNPCSRHIYYATAFPT